MTYYVLQVIFGCHLVGYNEEPIDKSQDTNYIVQQ